MEARERKNKSLYAWYLAGILTVCVPLLLPWKAAAGVFEASGGFSYSRTAYGDDSYSWTRRYTASLAFYFTELSSIEFAYQDAVSRNKIVGVEDTTFHDEIYSLNWVQHFTGRDFPIQPYVKGGVGQLDRRATGVYAGGGTPPREDDSFTVIAGGGLKLYLTKTFGLRGEATSYLTSGRLSTWKDNLSATAGVSIYF